MPRIAIAIILLFVSTLACAGVSLRSEIAKHEMLMPYSNWYFYLELAKSKGWKPTRTTKPRSPAWKGTYETGGYVSSDGQFVSASDAKAIASALRRAVVDPNLRTAAEKILSYPQFKEIKIELKDLLDPEHINEVIKLLEIGGVYLE
ncbi:MAG: hypothetical protein ACOVOX_14960 [Burkholderiaceae bacterium]